MRNKKTRRDYSRKPRRKARKYFKFVLATVFSTGITAGAIGVFVGYQYYNRLCGTPCVNLKRLYDFAPEQGSILYDRYGNELGALYRHHRKVIELSEMPRHLIQAFIDTEDRAFYEHNGVHYKRVVGATINNLIARKYVEGFSTITMQLARNLYPEILPATEKSLRRKLTEIRIAKDIEREFGKNEILKAYLNTIYLGAGAYGVEAAAQIYFGKSAKELTLAEAALIAGLAKAPSDYNPYSHPQKARERRNLVLRLMEKAGSISTQEANKARNTEISLAYSSIEEAHAAAQPRASYFINEIRRLLYAQLGDVLYSGGLRIYTTLDTLIQSRAEQILETHAARIDSLAALAAKKSHSVPSIEGAMVVMDAGTGDVLAMVGGRDVTNSQFNRATQARRQPGSVFKPFVYGAAIEAGCSPLDTVNNGYIRMTVGANEWVPKNFTQDEIETAVAPITLHEALRSSQNRATVHISQAVGLDRIIAFAHRIGISTPLPRVPSVVLGTASLRMLELIESYSVFARNDGARVKPRFVRRIEDAKGKILMKNEVVADTVVSPAVTYILRTILQDVVDNGTARSIRNAGYTGLAAGKTGTTDNSTDVWFIGLTPHYVAGVWFGYDQPRPIKLIQGQATGGYLAAPAWAEIMKTITPQATDSMPWSIPEGVDALEMRVVSDTSSKKIRIADFLIEERVDAPRTTNETQSVFPRTLNNAADTLEGVFKPHRQPRSICDVVFSPPFKDSLGRRYVWSYSLSRTHTLNRTKISLSENPSSDMKQLIGNEITQPPSF